MNGGNKEDGFKTQNNFPLDIYEIWKVTISLVLLAPFNCFRWENSAGSEIVQVFEWFLPFFKFKTCPNS